MAYEDVPNFSSFDPSIECINFRAYSTKLIRRLSKRRPKLTHRRSTSTPSSGHKISHVSHYSTFYDTTDFDYRAPMNELIQSEKRYIEDLKQCIEVYLENFRLSGPSTMKSKERQIFGNLEKLYEFHAEIFLNELLNYEGRPEDVGWCFITRMEELKVLYKDYLLNKEENNTVIFVQDVAKFFMVSKKVGY